MVLQTDIFGKPHLNETQLLLFSTFSGQEPLTLKSLKSLKLNSANMVRNGTGLGKVIYVKTIRQLISVVCTPNTKTSFFDDFKNSKRIVSLAKIVMKFYKEINFQFHFYVVKLKDKLVEQLFAFVIKLK